MTSMLTINNRRYILGFVKKFNNNPFSLKYGSQTGDESRLREVRKTVSKEIKSYALNRYVNYIKNYDKVLESRFPRAMHVYRVFAVGIKDFYQETKEYVRVLGLARTAKRNGAGIESLARKEVEVFYRMPREMKRVAPVLLISALPFANYIVFPVAYYFPKHLLSSHFWSLQQRYDFAFQDHKKGLKSFKPTFRCMQARISSIHDEKLKDITSMILSKLASGVHPSVTDILDIKVLFQGEPFHLNCLYPRHKNNLLKIHGMHTLWSRRRRLEERAQELYNADRALEREGVGTLTLDELRWACFSRGLNPSNMRSDDMLTWLNQWIAVSAHVDSSTLSLLLHCPILLAYNHPTNRVMMQ